jgi:hypothetical protein
MKHHCSVYRIDTGEIVQYSNFTCQDDDDLVAKNYDYRLDEAGRSEHAILKQETDPVTQYVAAMGDQVLVIERPSIPYQIDKTFIMAGGEDFCTISGLHDPCEVVIDDPDPLVETVTVTVTGGAFEFSADTAGVYTIQIDKFPFLLMTLEVIAVNPEAPETASYSSDFSFEFGL